MSDQIKHRMFARCEVCTRDIARWEDAAPWALGDGRSVWWHLDGWIAHGHEPQPGGPA